jgi:beta-fructofuranosidase
MDYDTLTFTPDGGYQFLDFGFDFYAAQFAANVSDPDKAILIAWIGLPDNHYCTEPEDWEGSMTVVRELRLINGKLVQSPVAAIETIRDGEAAPDGTLPAVCDFLVQAPEGSFDLNLFTKADGTGGFTCHYDPEHDALVVDRRGMDKRFNESVGEVLEVPLQGGVRNVRALIDKCSVELFINDGEATFTSHIYPTAQEHHYTVSPGAKVRIFNLKPSVTDDFVIE